MKTKICKSCPEKGEQPIERFEAGRRECKACRAAAKKAKVHAAQADRDETEHVMPTACIRCGKGPPEVAFKLRTDTVAGGYRNVCTSEACSKGNQYSKASRKRQVATDESAYLAKNAAQVAAWRAKQHE